MQDADAAARIVCVFSVLKVLNLHEEVQELVETFHNIDVDFEQSLQSPLALGVLIHGRKVDRVPARDIVLLSENLSVASNDITSVLLEQTHKSQVELAMALDCVSIVLHSLNKLSLFDVHCLHAETALLLL